MIAIGTQTRVTRPTGSVTTADLAIVWTVTRTDGITADLRAESGRADARIAFNIPTANLTTVR